MMMDDLLTRIKTKHHAVMDIKSYQTKILKILKREFFDVKYYKNLPNKHYQLVVKVIRVMKRSFRRCCGFAIIIGSFSR